MYYKKVVSGIKRTLSNIVITYLKNNDTWKAETFFDNCSHHTIINSDLVSLFDDIENYLYQLESC